MCVELRDRLPREIDRTTGDTPAAGTMRDDVVSALVNLGYHRQTIEKLVDPLFASAEPQRFEDILRTALKQLSRA
jgi:Holliday junction resolvasome RuvABC DNA-binding subunit